jgi:hypothetical protein
MQQFILQGRKIGVNIVVNSYIKSCIWEKNLDLPNFKKVEDLLLLEF